MPARTIGAAHFADDIRDLLTRLVNQDVDFMLVGGEAVIYHGYPRVTGNVDVFYRLTPANADRLFEALRGSWGGRVPGVKSASSLGHEGVIVQFGVSPHRVDFINRIDGVSFERAWKGSEKVWLTDGRQRLPVRFIGLDALILNKQACGRPKDLDDLRYLLQKSRSRRRR
jgi:hypothetical protein